MTCCGLVSPLQTSVDQNNLCEQATMAPRPRIELILCTRAPSRPPSFLDAPH